MTSRLRPPAHRLRVTVVLTGAFALLVSACGSAQETDSATASSDAATAEPDAPASTASPDARGSAADGDPLLAFVSILPQRHFVEEIAGDLVEVEVMVPPGASPATYEPDASQLEKLEQAELWFMIDVPFERARRDRLAAVGGDDLRLVRTWEDIDRRQLGTGMPDPHIWLSPELVETQARAIAEALGQADPEHADTYDRNLDAFVDDLRALDEDISETLQPYGGETFLANHPAWHYFADDYGLELITVEVGGNEPSAGELEELIQQAREEDISAVYVQPQFSTDGAEAIADQLGVEVERLDPLAPEWEANLQDVAETLAASFADEQEQG